MKKNLWIVVFIAVAFAGDRLIGWYLQNQISQSQFRYSKMYRGEGSSDLLVVGNSRGLNVFLPTVQELSGRNAFSICYNGMPGNIAEVMTKDYLEKYPTTKTVFLEVCMAEMADAKLVPGFATYITNSPRIDSLLKVESTDTWYGSKVSHIFRYNNEVSQRALYYMNRSDNDWISERVISPTLIKEAPKYGMKFVADPKQLQFIQHITKYCDSRGIEIKLLIAPFYPGFKLDNREYFKDQIEALTGKPVHDYSYNIKDTFAFSDYFHLNEKGAKEFVQQLYRDSILTNKPALAQLK